MTIFKVVATIALLFSLSGCASIFPETESPTTTGNSGTPSSPTEDVAPTSEVVPTPEETLKNEVTWDLYPGLKTKLDQLVQEKNCEALVMLAKDYLHKDKALDDYLQHQLEVTECS